MGMGTQSGFAASFQEFVFYAGPIIQLVYWVVLAVAAIWAVLLFKRLVDHKTGATASAELQGAEAKPAGRPVSVEEFVE